LPKFYEKYKQGTAPSTSIKPLHPAPPNAGKQGSNTSANNGSNPNTEIFEKYNELEV